MQTKLTLSIDSSLLVPIKAFARSEQTSVSQLVENYLKKLIISSFVIAKPKLHPITQSLTGSVKAKSKKSDRELIVEYLEKKHL